MVRRYGHIEPIERACYSHPSRLEVGFLPRPAVEERLRLSSRRQATKGGDFSWRKKPFSDLEWIELVVYPFHIDPDFPAVRDRDQGQGAGMRQVEPDRLQAGLTRECGLALRVVLKAQLLGP